MANFRVLKVNFSKNRHISHLVPGLIYDEFQSSKGDFSKKNTYLGLCLQKKGQKSTLNLVQSWNNLCSNRTFSGFICNKTALNSFQISTILRTPWTPFLWLTTTNARFHILMLLRAKFLICRVLAGLFVALLSPSTIFMLQRCKNVWSQCRFHQFLNNKESPDKIGLLYATR